MKKKELGKAGEDIAKNYLIENGFKILQTNFRCRIGEIDIIAQENDYIVFVEVKTRTNSNYGFPAEAINHKKKISIIRTAQTYLALNKIKDKNLRFDVIEIMMDNKSTKGKSEINLIRNAFWREY